LGHVARKRFGQHFLVDRSVIGAIVAAIAPARSDRLVEIGPGLAALTEALFERVPRLTAIEIDRDLAARLRRRFGERLELIEADALRVDLRGIGGGARLRVAGNLPYNISTPLLVHLLGQRDVVIDQHFMLQKEVVDRIVAPPGEAAYGRLGVLLQAYYDVESLFDVPPAAFDPPPRVDSSVVRMLPRADAPALDPRVLSSLLAAGFGQRRKMLRKTLLPWLQARGVEPAGISATDRPEDVPVAVWVGLAMALARAGAATD
jgi:16S rRNA (adenine1518-N6/adenine1519-N6)-dimethyltransferase